MGIYFSKLIKSGERQREFNFRRLTVNSEIKYNVDVPDEKGNRTLFQMSKDAEGAWKINTPDIPSHIYNVENTLNEAIQEHLSGSPSA